MQVMERNVTCNRDSQSDMALANLSRILQLLLLRDAHPNNIAFHTNSSNNRSITTVLTRAARILARLDHIPDLELFPHPQSSPPSIPQGKLSKRQNKGVVNGRVISVIAAGGSHEGEKVRISDFTSHCNDPGAPPHRPQRERKVLVSVRWGMGGSPRSRKTWF